MFLGYVDAQMLAAVYSMAEVFVYPSLYEGFGLPVVEAMACGVPVITSPRGALREIAGDAAVYIDPLDISNMADSLHEVLTDYNLKEALRARGFQRSAEFSWQTAAAQTLALYQRAVSGNSNRNHEARLEATPSRTIIR
jgi:glycosyltransferase involved in cell wall biosynthesis